MNAKAVCNVMISSLHLCVHSVTLSPFQLFSLPGFPVVFFFSHTKYFGESPTVLPTPDTRLINLLTHALASVKFYTGHRAVVLCFAAGKVTVGLVSHCLCTTHSPTGSVSSDRMRSICLTGVWHPLHFLFTLFVGPRDIDICNYR